MTLKVGYYPGCSLRSMQEPFDASVHQICRKLDIELKEPDDWSCCGASSGHAVDPDLTLAINARNLNLVGNSGLKTVAAPCASCYSNLKQASINLKDADKRARAESALKEPIKDVDVINVVDLLSMPEISQRIKMNMVKPFQDFKVACYYGCLMVRPKDETGAVDSENPQDMDDLLRMVGIETVDWSHKTECCGASSLLCNPEISQIRIGEVLRQAYASGADAVAVSCPVCHMNLEMTQTDERKIPVVYFTQLLGLALGCSEKDLELNKLLISFPWESKLK